MKPEPLSNEQIRERVIDNFNTHGFATQAVHDALYLKDQNTKTVVEWLKEYIKRYNVDIISVNDVIEIIDKAFEGVK